MVGDKQCSRGNQKFIDFTDKFEELIDGSYEIKIFNFRSYAETTLVKFKKQGGEYIETYNLKNVEDTDRKTLSTKKLNAT